jgi:GTP cyclohydrolase III
MNFGDKNDIFGQFGVYQLSFLNYRYDFILEINRTGIKLTNTKGVIEEFSFNDTVKIIPIHEAGEISLDVLKKNVSRRYYCSSTP